MTYFAPATASTYGDSRVCSLAHSSVLVFGFGLVRFASFPDTIQPPLYSAAPGATFRIDKTIKTTNHRGVDYDTPLWGHWSLEIMVDKVG